MLLGHTLGLLMVAPLAQEGAAPLFRDTVIPGSQLTAGAPAKDWILEVNGGGVVVEDFDGDGHLDVVLVDGSTAERAPAGEPGLPPRLLLGDGALGFRAPKEGAWELEAGRWGAGGAGGDLDGDGDVDLVVTNWGPDLVHRNTGAGFERVADAGLVGSRWGTSAALFDQDLDGVLDLYVVNYLDFDFDAVPSRASGECEWKGHAVNCGPEGLPPQADQLYRGLGDGRFEDVSAALGITAADACFGLGVVSGDFDADGDQDLYVTNDSMPNHYWRNDAEGEGRMFREVGMRLGVAVNGNGREEAGMGVAQGDVDGDGKTDFVVTNFSGESHSVYLSSGRRSYRDRSGPSGVGGASIPYLGWGTGLGDLDLDGDLDLYACHGHVYPQADGAGSDTSYAQNDVLWRGVDGVFVAEPLSDGAPAVSRAALDVDLDRDGDLDLLTVELDGGVHLLENTAAGTGGHWLGVRLVDPERSVVGARVDVVVGSADGPRIVSREATLSRGFQVSGPADVHLGLGAGGSLEGVRVRWSDGATEFFAVTEGDRWLTLTRGAGEDK